MRTFVSVLLVATALSGAAHAQNLVVALSPHVSEAERREQGEAVLTFLAETLRPGESADIIDGYGLARVATFAVPENRAYENPRARLNANRDAARAVLTLAPRAEREAGGVQRPLNFPGLLRYVGETYDGPLDLVVIGSPLYDMPLEPRASMAGGGVPGDGYIQSSRDETPFGAAGSADLLSGVRVHFAAIDPDWALHDRHAYAVERFNALEVRAFGGELVSFADDMETVFARVENHVSAPARDWQLEQTDKRDMIVFAPNTGSPASARDVQRGTGPYTGPARVGGPVLVGLYWECAVCDLDLYVRASPSADTLSYLLKDSPEGHFGKSFRQGAADTGDLEAILLDGPVNLADLRIWIDFYGGTAPGGVNAELRVTVGDFTYVRPVNIPAREGDYGVSRELVIGVGGNDPAWLEFEALALLRD